MKRISLLTLLFFFVFTAKTLAQAGLEVTVIQKENGNPISGLELTVTNKAIGFTENAVTDGQGKAHFTNLATSGRYTVTIPESQQYHSLITDPLQLQSNSTRSVTMVLSSKKTVELDEITVQAPITRINTIDAEVASKLDAEEIDVLPIEARDINTALYRLPNVVPATGFFPEAPSVSINGANSIYTNYLIDGMDNNEQFLGGPKFPIPTGFVQNVTVLTNNYSTEYGLSGNGVFNITTKSGSNQLEGEAFYVVRPGQPLDGETGFAQRDLTGNQVKEGFRRHQFGFGLGGPIVKDQTFFYLNAEQIFDLKDNLLNVPQLGINETVPGQNRFTLLSGKLDHHWSNNFRSSLRVNTGLINIERQGGGIDGGVTFPSASNSQDRNSFHSTLKNSYRVGEGLYAETNLQYSRFRWNYSNAANPDRPSATVLGPSEQTIAVIGNPGFQFDAIENTFQFQQKFTWYTGDHTLKAGASILSAEHSLLSGGNAFGNYTVKLNQQQLNSVAASNPGRSLDLEDIPDGAEVLNYSVELRPTRFGTRQNIYSFYMEDLYSVSSRLNLTFGLRYDYDNLSKGGSDSGDYNNLAPRFNFNYKLTDRSSLRGGYGLFYDKIVYSVYSDALQQSSSASDFKRQLQQLKDLGRLPDNTNFDHVTFDGNVSAGLNNVGYLQGPTSSEISADRNNIFSNSLRLLNPNGYDNPYTHQFSVGYQLQIDHDKLFYVDLMHTRSYNLFRLRDLNAPEPYPINPQNVVVRSQADADATRPIPIYSDENGTYGVVEGDTLRGIARNVIMTETKGESRYWAASFNLQKERTDDNYSYRLSYTLSRLRNNTEDINFRAMDANNFENEWGPSINDRTHVISGFFTWYPLDGFAINATGFLQSGQPINRIPDAEKYGTTDLNGDGRSFGAAYVGNSDRSPGEPRNSDRLPWATTFDVGIQYRLPVITGQKLEFRADIFNIFNAQNMSGYANNAIQSNQIQVGPRSSGRLVQKNASPPRQFQFSLRYLF